MRRRLIKLAGSLAVFLCAQEAALRLAFPLPELRGFNRALYMPQPEHDARIPAVRSLDLVWESAPDGARSVHRTNRYGFRDREWSVAKQPGTQRVAFFGDSFVEGVMAPQDGTIPQAFARAAQDGGQPVEVMNLGINGVAIDTYVRLVPEAASLFSIDVAVLVIYANDLGAPPPRHQPRSFPRWHRWTPRALELARMLTAGELLPMRWHRRSQRFNPPIPHPDNPWSADPEGLARACDPDLAEAIAQGRYNPYRVGWSAFIEPYLRSSIPLVDALSEMRQQLEASGTQLVVAYLPERGETSGHYAQFEERCDRHLGPPLDLTAPVYRTQRRSLGAQCERAGIPFLDLTPTIRTEEQAGHHLYWDYDDHMRQEGYALVGGAIHAWWTGR
jgi:hypothetical protein